MLKRSVLLLFCLSMVLPSSFSIPINANSRSQSIESSVISIDLPLINQHRAPLKQLKRKNIERLINGRQVRLQQVESGNSYQHQLNGVWDNVVGQIGFFYDFPKTGEAFISIIGLKTQPAGDGVYRTEQWDRNAFFFTVDGGTPIHLSAEYLDEYTDTDDPSLSVRIYHCYNVLYKQQGKDYSDTELGGEWINFELLTDVNNNVLDYNILTRDENDEFLNVKKFQIGDQLQSWTTVFLLDDPDAIWVTTMEEDFRTIQSDPEFMYTHLTPNVDYPNTLTQDTIDFPGIDLNLVLFGVNESDEAITPFQFSTPKRMKIQWDGTVSSGVSDWLYQFLK